MRSEQSRIRRVLVASALVLGASAVASPALAAVFTVNDTSDRIDVNPADGICRTAVNTCTLRAAVMQANASAGPDTIRLQGGATYALTRPGADDTARNGDLDIWQNVQITVLPAGALATVRGNGMMNDGIFHVLAGNNVRFERVVVDQQGAGTTGVGIRIEAGARLTTDRVQVVRCVTTTNGAGIRNLGNLTMINSLVGLNRASRASGGGVFNARGAVLSLSSTNFRTNTATGSGGAIYSLGRVTVQQGSTLVNNSAWRGGGIFQEAGGTSIAGSTLTLNQASDKGGALFQEAGRTSIVSSTLTRNQASDKGGAAFVTAGALDMIRSTADSNVAGLSGGALWNSAGGVMTLVNSTLSGNRAQRHGGAIYNDDDGRLRAFSTTIATNVADSNNDGNGSGGGVFNATRGDALTTGAIVARNTRRLVAPAWNDCNGTVRSGGHNLVGTRSACGFIAAGTDQVGAPATPIDPRLGPLAPNGGPTRTHALLAGSTAIDRGNPAGCRDQTGAILTTDQRGVARPRDGNGDGSAICDIGSYER